MAADVQDLVAGIGRGDRRALARLLTVVEDGRADQLRAAVAALHPHSGGARVIGITGPPGVGKSTLADAIAAVLRAADRTVAILAVDPSSPLSGGALLGDRVRMQGHHADPGVFIRSMASRGRLGGLAFSTPQAVLVLDAAGFDDVIVETVGVGQTETDVAATADCALVTLAPGMGDGIQAAKAGILEVADVLVVNKADQPGAGMLESELRTMVELGHVTAPAAAEDRWWPPIVRTVGVRPEGVDDVVAAIVDHDAHLDAGDRRSQRMRARAQRLVREIALEQVRRRFTPSDATDTLLDALAGRVADRDLDPYAAADQALDAWTGDG